MRHVLRLSLPLVLAVTLGAPMAVATPAAAAPSTVATLARATCGAPANPFGFNFCGRGGYVYRAHLPSTVCRYFRCIPNFRNGVGYLVECRDGWYSMSGGRPGACSYHHGVWRPVYRG